MVTCGISWLCMMDEHVWMLIARYERSSGIICERMVSFDVIKQIFPNFSKS